MKNFRFSRTVLLLVMVFTIILSVTGGTIAWFSDSVTSETNVLKSGNLDVALYYTDHDTTTKTKVDENTKLFTIPSLWEPGAVAYTNLYVANEGTLNLKYQLTMNATNATKTPAGKTLMDALQVAIVDKEVTATNRQELLNSVQEWQSFDSFMVNLKIILHPQGAR